MARIGIFNQQYANLQPTGFITQLVHRGITTPDLSDEVSRVAAKMVASRSEISHILQSVECDHSTFVDR